jgi:hypothetical protein
MNHLPLTRARAKTSSHTYAVYDGPESCVVLFFFFGRSLLNANSRWRGENTGHSMCCVSLVLTTPLVRLLLLLLIAQHVDQIF